LSLSTKVCITYHWRRQKKRVPWFNDYSRLRERLKRGKPPFYKGRRTTVHTKGIYGKERDFQE